MIPLYGRDGVVAQATIDPADLPLVEGLRWYLDSQGYPSCRRLTGRRPHRTYTGGRMHEVILGKTPPGLVTDHRNGDKLDNRRTNLRHIPQGGNCQNLAAVNGRGFRGAYLDRRRGTWYAQVKHRNVKHTRGGFATAEEAARVAAAMRAELLPYDERGAL